MGITLGLRSAESAEFWEVLQNSPEVFVWSSIILEVSADVWDFTSGLHMSRISADILEAFVWLETFPYKFYKFVLNTFCTTSI